MIRKQNEAGRLLAQYAALLLRSGATCAQVEKNVGRMARSWSIDAVLTILPRHVNVSVSGSHNGAGTFVADIGASAVSFDKITRLCHMSEAVADNHLGVTRAWQMLDSISNIRNADKCGVLLAVSCANAAFCRLFSGDMMAALVVGIATFCGYYLKQTLLERRVDVRLVFIICAFVSSVLACADSLFSLGGTPGIAIATSVLYLVPGIPLLNSFSDMLDRHYICFFSRLTDAAVLTCCLSTGLCAGMWVMRVGMF